MSRYVRLFLSLALLVTLTVTSAFATPPTRPAKYLSVQVTSADKATVKWRNGNGSGRALLISKAASVTFSTVDADLKTAITNFGGNADGNWNNKAKIPNTTGDDQYVIGVWDDNTRTVDLTNLVGSSDYYIQVVEYNKTGTDYEFNNTTSSLNPRGFKTGLAAPTVENFTSSDGIKPNLTWKFEADDLPTNGGFYLDILDVGAADFVDPYDLLDIGKPDMTTGSPETWSYVIDDIFTNIKFPDPNERVKHRVRAYDNNGKPGPASAWEEWDVPADPAPPTVTALTTSLTGGGLTNGYINNEDAVNGETLSVKITFSEEMNTSVIPTLEFIGRNADNDADVNVTSSFDYVGASWDNERKVLTMTYTVNTTEVALSSGVDITFDNTEPLPQSDMGQNWDGSYGTTPCNTDKFHVDTKIPYLVKFLNTVTPTGGNEEPAVGGTNTYGVGTTFRIYAVFSEAVSYISSGSAQAQLTVNVDTDGDASSANTLDINAVAIVSSIDGTNNALQFTYTVDSGHSTPETGLEAMAFGSTTAVTDVLKDAAGNVAVYDIAESVDGITNDTNIPDAQPIVYLQDPTYDGNSPWGGAALGTNPVQIVDGKKPSIIAIAVSGISRADDNFATDLNIIDIPGSENSDNLYARNGVQNLGTSATDFEKVGLWSPSNTPNGLFLGANGGAQAIRFKVYFDEPVVIPGGEKLTFKTNLNDDCEITYTNTTGSNFTSSELEVIYEIHSGDAATLLNIINDGFTSSADIEYTGNVTDVANNALNTSFVDDLDLTAIDTDNNGTDDYYQFIRVETSAPEVQNGVFIDGTSTSNRQEPGSADPFAENEVLTLTLTFSESVYYGEDFSGALNFGTNKKAVVLTGNPAAAVAGKSIANVYAGDLGTKNAVDFKYTVVLDDFKEGVNFDGDYPFTCAALPASPGDANYIYDEYGNRTNLTTEGYIPFGNTDITIDGVKPTIVSVTQADNTPDGTYGEDNKLQFVVTFDEPIAFTPSVAYPNCPDLELVLVGNTGMDGAVAKYHSKPTDNTMVFEYTVDGDDMANDLNSGNLTVVAPGTSDLTDVAGNLIVTPANTPVNETLAENAAIVVNTTDPVWADNKVMEYFDVNAFTWVSVADDGNPVRAKIGDRVRFYAYFTSTITGFNGIAIPEDNPRMQIATNKYANYSQVESNLSGTAPYYLAFEYEVVAGDAIAMDGGTTVTAANQIVVEANGSNLEIRDNFGNPCSTLNNPNHDVDQEDNDDSGSTYDAQKVYLDGIVPTVTIAANRADDFMINTVATSNNIIYTFTFSEEMSVAVDPTIVIKDGNDTDVTSNFTTSANTWNGPTNDTYTITYTPNADVNLTGCYAEISEVKDLAGNAIVTTNSKDTPLTFNVDTERPADPTIVVTTDHVDNKVNSTNLDVTITVTYAEAMTGTPGITLTDVNDNLDEANTFTAISGEWDVDHQVYTATVTHDGTEETGEINFTVANTSVTDAAGNLCANAVTSTPNNIVDTDIPAVATTNGIVTDLTVTVDGKDWITDATVTAGTFTVTITFDEAMDASSSPNLLFDPTIASTITGISNSNWTTGNTVYTVTYNLADAGVTVEDVDYDVAGFVDANGNAMVADETTGQDLFSIDTENPYATAIEIASTDANRVPAGGTTYYAKHSENVTVTANYNENVVIANATICSDGTLGVASATAEPAIAYTLDETNDATFDGSTATFTIEANDVTDARGNHMDQDYTQASTFDHDSDDTTPETPVTGVVNIDFTAPTITDVAYDGDNDIIYNQDIPGTYHTKLTISEAVYNTDDASGAVEKDDFAHTFTPDVPPELEGVTLAVKQDDCSTDLVGGESTICVEMAPNGTNYATGGETITFNAVANSIYDIAGNAMATTATTAVNFPSVAPFITDIAWAGDAPTGTDPYYVKDDVITVNVTFCQNVAVQGTPTLTIVNSTDANETLDLTYTATTDNVVTFTYTVKDGDNVCGLDKYSTITLNSATIKNAGNTDANLTSDEAFDAARSVDGDTPEATVTVSTNAGSSACLVEGDVITVEAVVTDESCATLVLSTPVFENYTLNGTWTTWEEDPTGTWTTTYTIHESDLSVVNPSLDFTITDAAGNEYTYPVANETFSIDANDPEFGSFVTASTTLADTEVDANCINKDDVITANFIFSDEGCANTSATTSARLVGQEPIASEVIVFTTDPTENTTGGGAFTLSTPYTYTVTGNEASGTYKLETTITDAEGNTTVTIHEKYVKIDNDFPTITVESFSEISVPTEPIDLTIGTHCLNSGTLEYTFDISDDTYSCDDIDYANSTIELLIDDSVYETITGIVGTNDKITDNGDGTFTYTTDLPTTGYDGENVEVKITVIDGAGNTITSTSTEVIYLDNTAPSLTLGTITPAVGCLTNGETIKIRLSDISNTGTCTVFYPTADITVEIVDGVNGNEDGNNTFGLFASTYIDPTTYDFSYTLADADMKFEGDAYLKVTVKDDLNNTNTYYTSVIGELDKADPFTDDLALDETCVSLDVFGTSLTLTGTLEDTGCGLAGTPYYKINDGTAVNFSNGTLPIAGTPASFDVNETIDISGLDGACTLAVTFLDAVGRSHTENLTFTVDNDHPVLTLTNNDTDDCYVHGEAIRFTASFTDATSCGPIENETVYITTSTPNTYTFTEGANDLWEWEEIKENDLVGELTVTYTVTDAAGNISTETHDIIINDPDGFQLAENTDVEIAVGNGFDETLTYSTNPVCLKNGSTFTMTAEFEGFGCIVPDTNDFTPVITYAVGNQSVSVNVKKQSLDLVAKKYTAWVELDDTEINTKAGQYINVKVQADDGNKANVLPFAPASSSLITIDVTAPNFSDSEAICRFVNGAYNSYPDNDTERDNVCFGTNDKTIHIQIQPTESCSDWDDVDIEVTFTGCDVTGDVNKFDDGTNTYHVYDGVINSATSQSCVASVVATDEAGNASNPKEINFNFDYVDPVVSNVHVVDNTTTDPCSVNGGNYTLEFVVADVVANSCGAIDENDIVITTPNATTISNITYSSVVDVDATASTKKYTYTFDVADAGDENVTFAVNITDPKGNSSNTGNTTVWVDNTAPTIVYATMLSEECMLNTDSFELQVSANDNRDSECPSEIEVVISDGASFSATLSESSSSAGLYEVTDLSSYSGDYTWTVTITDQAGNTPDVETGTFRIDDADPVVTVADLADDCVKAGDALTMTGTISDDIYCGTDEFAGTLEVEYWSSATTSLVYTSTITHTAAANYTINEVIPAAADLTDGEYNVVVRYTDVLGNEGYVNLEDGVDEVVLTVDNVAPEMGPITMDTGDDCVGSEETEVTFTVNVSNLSVCSGLLTVDNFTPTITGATDITEDWTSPVYTVTFTAPAVTGTTNEDFDITVDMTDNAGRESSITNEGAFTVDVEAPVITSFTMEDNVVCFNSSDADRTVTLTAEITDNGCGVIDGTAITTTSYVKVGAWTYNQVDDNYTATLTIPANDAGNKLVGFTVVDDAGNSTDANKIQFYIDGNPPVFSVEGNYLLNSTAITGTECAKEDDVISFEFKLEDGSFDNVANCGDVSEANITKAEVSLDGGSTYYDITNDNNLSIVEGSTDGQFTLTYTIPATIGTENDEFTCNDNVGVRFRLTGVDAFDKENNSNNNGWFNTQLKVDNTAPDFTANFDPTTVTCFKPTQTVAFDVTITESGAECADGIGGEDGWDADNAVATAVDYTGGTLPVVKGEDIADGWTITIPANAANGEATITLTLSDDNDNSTTEYLNFDIDNQAPIVTSLLMSNTTEASTCFRGGEVVTLTFNAADAANGCSTFNASNITIYQDTDSEEDGDYTDNLGSPVAGSIYDWEKSITLPTEGTEDEYTYFVVATDGAGNTSTESITVYVDDKAPVLSDISGPTCITDGTAVEFTFTATDGLNNNLCTDTFNANDILATFSDPILGIYENLPVSYTGSNNVYKVTINPNQLYTGEVTLTINAQDNLIWEDETDPGTHDSQLTYPFEIDNEAPVITEVIIDGTVDCFAGGEEFTVGVEVQPIGDDTDEDSSCSNVDWNEVAISITGPAGSNYSWSNDNSGADDSTAVKREWNYTLPANPVPGTYTVEVTVKDGLGNTSTDTDTFTVNNTPPTITDLTVEEDDNEITCARAVEAYTLSFKVSDQGGCDLDPSQTVANITDGNTPAAITLLTPTTEVFNEGSADEYTVYTYTSEEFNPATLIPGLADGADLDFTVEVENVGGASANDLFESGFDQTSPSTGPITNDLTSEDNCTNSNFTLTVTASDTGCGTLDGDDITITITSSTDTDVTASYTGTNQITDNDDGTFDCDVDITSLTAEGLYDVAVAIRDDAGNEANANGSFNIDRMQPTTPVVVLSELAGGNAESCFKKEVVHIKVTSNDTGGCGTFDHNDYTIIIKYENDSPLNPQPDITWNSTDEDWTMDLNDIDIDDDALARLKVVVYATDDAGNKSTEVPTNFTVDNFVPEISSITVDDDCITEDNTVSINVAITDLACNFDVTNDASMQAAAERINVYVGTTSGETGTSVSNNITGSGIKHITFYGWEKTQSSVVFTYTWTVPSTSDGDLYVFADYTDHAGNINNTYTTNATVTYDGTPPTATENALLVYNTNGGTDCAETNHVLYLDFDTDEITETGCGLVNDWSQFTVIANNVDASNEDVNFIWRNNRWEFDVLLTYPDQQNISIDVTFVDNAGLENTVTFNNAFNIDNHAPAAGDIAIADFTIDGTEINSKWMNASDQAVNLGVQLPNDATLIGGKVKLEVKEATSSDWSEVTVTNGSETTLIPHTIVSGDIDRTITITTQTSNWNLSDGTYNVRLVVEDYCGHTTEDETYTNTLKVDKTAPTLSDVAIASNDESAPTWANPDESVVLTFTASETLTGNPTVTFSVGTTYRSPNIENPTGNDYECTYAVKGGGQGDMPEGPVSFSIANYTDVAGNAGTTVTSGTGSVTVDKTEPANLAYASVVATGGNVVAGYYNATNTGVTLTTATLPNDDASLNGGSIDFEWTVSKNQERTLTSNDFGNAVVEDISSTVFDAVDDTEVEFSLTLTDAAGNENAIGYVAAGSKSLIVDLTSPAEPTFAVTVSGGKVVTGYLNSTNDAATIDWTVPNDATLVDGTAQLGYYENAVWTNIGTAYTITSTDLGNSINIDRFTALDGLSDGTYSLYLKVTDVAGNATITSAENAQQLIIDQDVPEVAVSITSNGNNRTAGGNWVTADNTVTVTLSGDALTTAWTATVNGENMNVLNATTAEYTFDNNDNYTGQPDVDLDGLADAAGNPATTISTTNNAYYDFVAPAIDYNVASNGNNRTDGGKWVTYGNTVTVALSGDHADLVSGWTAEINSLTMTTGTANATYTFSAANDHSALTGQPTIAFTGATDEAGNVAVFTNNGNTAWYDFVSPVVTLINKTFADGTGSTDRTPVSEVSEFGFTSTGGTQPKVKINNFNAENIAAGSNIALSSIDAFKHSLTDGTGFSLTITDTDEAGNTHSGSYDYLVKDVDPPSILPDSQNGMALNADNSVLTITFDEDVYKQGGGKFTISDAAAFNNLIFDKGNGNMTKTITNIIHPVNHNYRVIQFAISYQNGPANGSEKFYNNNSLFVYDKAGNRVTGGLHQVYLNAQTTQAVVDAITSTNSGCHKVGDVITITASWNENVTNANGSLTLSNGATATYSSISNGNVVYTYTVTEQPNDGMNTTNLTVTTINGTITTASGTANNGLNGNNISGISVDANSPALAFEGATPASSTRVSGNETIDIAIIESSKSTTQYSFDNSNWEDDTNNNLEAGTITLSNLNGWGTLQQGTFTLYIRHTDGCGNVSTTARSFVKDTEAPIVTATIPASDVTIAAPGTVIVRFSEAMNSTDLATTANYSVTAAGNAVTVTNATAGANGLFATLTINDLTSVDSNGEKIIVTVTGAKDLAGNTVDVTNNVGTYTYSGTTAPSIITVSWMGTTSTGYYNSDDELQFYVTFDQAVNVTGTATITMSNGATATCNSGNNSSTIYFEFDGEGNTNDLDITGTSITLGNGASIQSNGGTDADLSFGSHSLATGRHTDNTDPVITAVTPVAGCVTGSEAINVTVTETNTYTLQARLGNSNWGSISNGALLSSINGYVANTAQTLTVRATDAAGNVSANYAVNYTFDNVRPTVSSALGTPTNTTVEVTFTDANLDETSAETTSNYSLSSNDGTWTNATVSAASLNTNTNVVTLTVPNYSGLGNGKTITVTVTQVQDCAGNTMITTAATYTKAGAVVLTVTKDGNLYANTSTGNTITVASNPVQTSGTVTLTGTGVTTATADFNNNGVATFNNVYINDNNSGKEGVEDLTFTAAYASNTGTADIVVLPVKPTGTPTNLSVIGGRGKFEFAWSPTNTAEGAVVFVRRATLGTPSDPTDGATTPANDGKNYRWLATTSNSMEFATNSLLKKKAYQIKLAEYNVNGGTTYTNTATIVSFGPVFGNGSYNTTRKDGIDGEGEIFTMSVDNVYPNPASTNFTMDVQLDEERELTVTIFDEEGRIVMQPIVGQMYNAGMSTINVDIDQTVASGNYMISITSGDEALVAPLQIVK